jgi:hypothetical protein
MVPLRGEMRASLKWGLLNCCFGEMGAAEMGSSLKC